MALFKFFNKNKDDEEQQQVPQIQLSPLQKTLLNVSETVKNAFPVLKTPLGRTIMSVFVPGLSPALKLDEQNQKLLELSGYKPKPIEIDVNKIPLVDLAAKGAEGFIEGATLGLVDLPFKKSETTAQKLAYGAGNLAGMLSPEGLFSKGAKVASSIKPIKLTKEGLVKIAEKVPQKSIAGKIVSSGIKSVGEGIPYTVSALSPKIIKGEIESPKQLGKEVVSQSKWDLAVGSAFPALAALPFFSGGIKEKAIETGEELASKIAKEFNKKAGEGITLKLSDILKKFNLSDELLDKLDKQALTGKNFSIQKIGKNIEFIFDEGFKPISLKGLKVAVKEKPKINLKQKGVVKEEVAIKPEIEAVPKAEKATGIKSEIPKIKIKKENLKTAPPSSTGKVKINPPVKEPPNILPIVKRDVQTDIVPKFTPEEIPPVREPRVFFQSEAGQAIPEDELASVYYRKQLEKMPEGLQKESASRVLERGTDIYQRTKKIVEETPQIKEDKLLGGLWDKLGLTNIVNRVNEKLHRAGITSFNFKSDPRLDEEARTTTQLILNSVRNNIENFMNVARKQASDILERKITDDELSALVRNEVEETAKLQMKQATKVKLGKEFFTETGEVNQEVVNKLKDAVKGLGEEIQSHIIAYDMILDDLLAQGANKEAIEKARLAGKEAIWKNLGSYLRTTYNKDLLASVLGGEKIYRPALFEYANYTPSQKEKLSLMEWAQGYLAKLKEDDLNINDHIPDHLLEGVLAGRKDDLEALGRIVKEMAGYETGVEGITKTMNYLATNYYNLTTQMLILKNKDLVSDVAKEGFVQVVEKNFPALFGKYVRSDVYNDLVEMVRYQQRIPDIFNLYSSLWKYGMVVGRPAAWVRNFLYGFYAQQTFAGNSPLNPANWKYFIKGKDLLRYLVDPTKATKEVKLFIENGGGSGSFVQEEVRIGILDYLKEHKGNPENLSFYQNLINSLLDKGASISQAYSTIDTLNKFILFTKRLKEGDTVEQAILYSNKYLNNYMLNPKLFRELSKNPIVSIIFPFISFVVANTPVILETIINNPHRIALFVSPFLAYKTMLRLYDPEFYAQSEIQKPYYQKNNPLYIPISYDEETGKIYYEDFSLLFNIPMRTDLKEQAIETARAMGGSFVMPGGPFQSLSTAITGKDIFGQDVDVPLGEGRLGALLKMAPGGLLLTEIMELVKDFLGKPYSSSGKVRTKIEGIANFLGLNIYHTLPNQLKKNVSAYERELADYKARINSVIKSPEVSMDVKTQLMNDAVKKEIEIRGKIRDLLKPVIPVEINNVIKTKGIDLNSIPLIDKDEQKMPLVSFEKGGGVPVSYKQRLKIKTPKIPKVSLKLPKREKAKKVKLPKIKPYVVSNR